ncbi:MAG: PEP-CTERM-box response regulator transcription factor [Verrucomicrobia bacterium]|nr:PEP-CTERM-box response regulator transcription factor [Verrucomicrobiota bacterium]
MKPTLLIVDDDEEIRSQMKWALAQDYEVLLAGDRASALETFREKRPFVALLDLGLPPHPNGPEEGLATLSDLLVQDRLAKVIIITGQGDRDNALRAVADGAYDFLCKPAQMEELRIILKRAFHLAHLEREYRDMQQHLASDTFEGMLGTSAQMQDVFNSIRKVATTEAPVLVLGESGTGKEMAALAIHRRGARKDGPFVAINCGAIPDTLLESELFGHEKGAFTGAHIQRQGRIETANKGTLFLDEIGELPPPLQVKLLRFLQEQTIERVGGRTQIQIDARVIAATNMDLTKAMTDGKFREDLYYRLAVVVIKLPPLRERQNDIALVAQSFLQKFATENSKGTLKFTKEALRALEQHPWPGNVRELENRVKRAVIMAEGKGVTPADLELASVTSLASGRSLKDAREAVERELIQQALRKHGGKISPAAADLGISRPTLYEMMEKLGINREQA